MNAGKTVFAQFLGFIPFHHFEHLVDKFGSNRWVHSFSAWSHFICMAYAQLTRRRGLRDLVACLNSHHTKLYHVGLRQRVSRSTLAEANELRDARLFEALGQRLITQALDLYRTDAMPLGLHEPLYAMDATVIDLCLNLFAWADARSTKAGIKAHVALDLRGAIPVLLTLTTAKVADSSQLDALHLPNGSIVVLDRGYIDFKRLHQLTERGMSFVVRAKGNLQWRSVQTHAVGAADKACGVRADHTIALCGQHSQNRYPTLLRRVRFFDEATCLELVFLTDRLDLPALTIAQIYKQRWQVELFFKWLKQHLSIDHFFGNSQNAVKTQVWIAICVYLITLMMRKKLKLDVELSTLMHLLEVNLFEKVSIEQMVRQAMLPQSTIKTSYQKELF
jgi:transposase